MYHIVKKEIEDLSKIINPLSYGVSTSYDELGFSLCKWGKYEEAYEIINNSFNAVKNHYGEKAIEMGSEYLKIASVKYYLVKSEEDRKNCLDIIKKGLECNGLTKELIDEYNKLTRQVNEIKL